MLMQYLYLYDYTGIIWVIDKMKTRWWASQIFRYYHAVSSWHFKQGIRHVIADIKKVLFKINYTFIIARQNEWHIFVVFIIRKSTTTTNKNIDIQSIVFCGGVIFLDKI